MMVEVHTLRNLRVKALTLQSTMANLNAFRGQGPLCELRVLRGRGCPKPHDPKPQKPFDDLEVRTIRDVIFYYIAITIIHQWLISYSG
jgi:hypothetical protein